MRLLPLIIAALLAGPAAAAPAWSPPRTPDGRPDLQGVWTNASITKLERPAGLSTLVVSPEAAAQVAARDPLVRFTAESGKAVDPNAPPPVVGGVPGAGNLDSGTSLARVHGEFRSSWIVDPADGRLPFSAEGRRRLAEAQAFARGADAPSDPEALQPWDRCLISSRGSGGPGMLNNIYNSNLQIVQTKDRLGVEAEMVHDLRSIPILASKAAAQAAHGPAAVQPWLGDSTAWWEGDTLVVETVNVRAEQGRAGPIFLTPQGRVVERFTRTGPQEITYAFEVEDPAYYSRPWRAEMSLILGPQALFEYACHEGNYALPGILRGARPKDGPAAAGGAR